MGIRNPASWRDGSGCARPHYPSWGSGTSLNRAAMIRYRHSLPLMGIRNKARLMHPVLSDPLTTPHGDQELPLGREGVGCPVLTTPHGDQEPTQPTNSTGWPTSHYPSWGSGTRLQRVDHTRHLVLTTPHGDQERMSRMAESSDTVSHYPSWGSGTRGPSGEPPAPSSHYPSWGSGTNVQDGRVVGHRVSLPLMGIRNPFIFRHFSLLMGSGSVQHACSDRQNCAWTPGQRWFSAQAQGIPSENGPVFPVPFVFFLAHLSAELIFSESAYFDVVPILGNEL